MAWLDGWSKRIEIKIEDYAGDFNGSVTWFPATVFLTATQAEEVFAELTTDGEYNLMQFTEADGTSLLYGHMKVFDVAGTKGIFTVSADGWTIDGNTSIFLYYDAGHAVNGDYIGVTNTSACEAVYNPQYKAVYPMANGANTSSIYDATDNNNDGTKLSAGNPVEATGKIGQAQEFSGDWIDFASSVFPLGAKTIELLIKTTIATNERKALIQTATGAVHYGTHLHFDADGYLNFKLTNNTGAYKFTAKIPVTDINNGEWHYIAFTWDGTTDANKVIAYVDGSPVDTDTSTATEVTAQTYNLRIGALQDDAFPFSGTIDEVYISDTVRSAAWVKGAYNSAWDSLFTYGSEEEAPVVEVDNAIFMGCNF